MDQEFEESTKPSEEFQDIIQVLPSLRVNDLVMLYRDKRDELDAARKVYKQKEANVKDLLARISMALRDLGDQLGVDSFATPYGTAFRTVKTHYRVGNWDNILQFIQQTGNYQMLEKRVAKNATKEIHDALGHVPPGVDYSAEVEFSVRKPSARKS